MTFHTLWTTFFHKIKNMGIFENFWFCKLNFKISEFLFYNRRKLDIRIFFIELSKGTKLI